MSKPVKPSRVTVNSCPKCGGKPKWGEIFCRYYVICGECEFRGPYRLDLREAVKAWNEITPDMPLKRS